MRGAVALCFVLALAAQARAEVNESQIIDAFAEYSLPLPNIDAIVVCHGFGCRYRTEISLTSTDHAQMKKLLAKIRTPEAERKAVASTVAWFDRRVGGSTGTVNHVARAGMTYANDPSQFDCIDSSRNTMTVLALLEDMKLLRFHKLGAPVARGHLIDLRPPHVTAVLIAHDTGQQWAVDSWTRSYGQPAEVLPLHRWLKLD